MKSLASPFPMSPTYFINRDISDKLANDYIGVIFPSICNLVLFVISKHFHYLQYSVKLTLSLSHKWHCTMILIFVAVLAMLYADFCRSFRICT